MNGYKAFNYRNFTSKQLQRVQMLNYKTFLFFAFDQEYRVSAVKVTRLG